MSKVTVTPASLPTSLSPFTGVNNATARLLKAISQFELNSLEEGDVVYVESVRDYWKWLPASTITSDDITYCAPTVVGVGAGRFERLMWSSPDWNQQTEWHIASTGNDENSGLAGFPLLTTAERRRRWGDNFQLLATTAYHIRYLSNGYSDHIRAFKAASAVIYCHASTVNGEGASILFGPANVDATDTLNTATGQPYTITCNAIPVSWNASGLNGAPTRLRLTTGALSISCAGIQDAGNPKKTYCDEFLIPVASLNAAPFVAPATTQGAPVVNDTFVVESYRSISRLHIDVINPPGAASTTTTSVVLDSISTILTGGLDCGIYCYSCSPSTLTGKPAFITYRSCPFATLSLNDIGLKSIIGGSVFGALVLCGQNPATSTITNFTLPGNTTTLVFNGAGSSNGTDNWRPGQIGAHNHTTASIPPIQIFESGVRIAAATWLPYGIGNTATLIGILFNSLVIAENTCFNAKTTGYQTTAPNIIGLWTGAGYASTAPAFDETTGIYTAPILLSRANLEATVAAGGFNYIVSHPSANGGGSNHF